jgi:hypothetical protein
MKKEKQRDQILKYFVSIKNMRFLKLSADKIVDYSEKILFKESERIFNEHAIRLLVENEINYTR